MMNRLDNRLMASMIEKGSRVLDLGCGAGDLLALLQKEKGVIGQGIELDDKAIMKCAEKGLSVFHSDIDSGLKDFPDNSFDYVVLNNSMQEVKKVDFVITEALRVGRKVIVGFPNFNYLNSRLQIFFLGRTPVTPSLPYKWYDTPNLHFLSISDFAGYCREKGINVIEKHFISGEREVKIFPNLFAQNALFLVEKRKR